MRRALLAAALLLLRSGGAASDDAFAQVDEDGSVALGAGSAGAHPDAGGRAADDQQQQQQQQAPRKKPGKGGWAPLKLKKGAQPAPAAQPLPTAAPRAAAAAAPAAAAPDAFHLPPGRVLEFHASCRPNGFALVPSRNAIVVTDGVPHGDKYSIPQIQEQMGWLEWALWRAGLGAEGPYPLAYLVSTEGELVRTLEFVDREALARGAAESLDAHLAFTFYQGPGLEVWDDTLDVKMTYHELSRQPSTPVFDTDGLLWLPYTVGDRMGEEGQHAPVVCAYRRDGTRFETLHRRQLGVAYPAALHFDAQGRLALAGLSAWVFSDGMYGQEVASGGGGGLYSPGEAPARLEFYTLSGDRSRSEYSAEQRARWAQNTGAAPAPGEAEAQLPLAAVPLLEASYDFPFPDCLHALFALTGDGHALTACRGSPALRVVRYGYPVGLRAAARRELAEAAAAAESLPGRKQVREAWAPPLAPWGAAAIRLLPSNASHLRADLAAPWGVGGIGGLAMAPGGGSFVLLDSGSAPARLLSIPWPWEDLQDEEAFGGSSGEVGEVPIDTRMVLTVAPELPAGLVTQVPEPPRSS